MMLANFATLIVLRPRWAPRLAAHIAYRPVAIVALVERVSVSRLVGSPRLAQDPRRRRSRFWRPLIVDVIKHHPVIWPTAMLEEPHDMCVRDRNNAALPADIDVTGCVHILELYVPCFPVKRGVLL